MFRFAKILNWWLPDFSCSPDELIVPCTELNDIIGGTDNRCALARLRTLGRGGAREEKRAGRPSDGGGGGPVVVVVAGGYEFFMSGKSTE